MSKVRLYFDIYQEKKAKLLNKKQKKCTFCILGAVKTILLAAFCAVMLVIYQKKTYHLLILNTTYTSEKM